MRIECTRTRSHAYRTCTCERGLEQTFLYNLGTRTRWFHEQADRFYYSLVKGVCSRSTYGKVRIRILKRSGGSQHACMRQGQRMWLGVTAHDVHSRSAHRPMAKFWTNRSTLGPKVRKMSTRVFALFMTLIYKVVVFSNGVFASRSSWKGCIVLFVYWASIFDFWLVCRSPLHFLLGENILRRTVNKLYSDWPWSTVCIAHCIQDFFCKLWYNF